MSVSEVVGERGRRRGIVCRNERGRVCACACSRGEGCSPPGRARSWSRLRQRVYVRLCGSIRPAPLHMRALASVPVACRVRACVRAARAARERVRGCVRA
eukprot:943743-Pleurochrysis_carterae.AAC.2